MYTITYSGCWAQMSPFPNADHMEALIPLLSYVPAGSEFSPKHKGNKFIMVGGKRKYNKAAHWDGSVCLLRRHKKSNSVSFPTGMLSEVEAWLTGSSIKFSSTPLVAFKPEMVPLDTQQISVLFPHQVAIIDIWIAGIGCKPGIRAAWTCPSVGIKEFGFVGR